MLPSVVKQCVDPWSQLEQELDEWVSSKCMATLWWRDDDAVKPGQKLDRLIELTSDAGLLLAVIPFRAAKSLARLLNGFPHVQIAQHGYAHENHAPRGQGSGAWELGMHRGETVVLNDLAKGRERLEELFGSAFIPVVVPPWNRIAPELLIPIAARGYKGVSAFGPANLSVTPSELIIANAHCDPIRWKNGAMFAGESKTISQLVAHLESRRCGQPGPDEHTGFLTHHIDLDGAGWEFCSRLLTVINEHPGARWISPTSVFGVSA